MHLYMTLILELGIYTVFYKPIHWNSGWTSELQMIVKDGNVMCKKKKWPKLNKKTLIVIIVTVLALSLSFSLIVVASQFAQN